MDHLLTLLGNTKVEMAEAKNSSNINGIPVKFELFMRLAKYAVTTEPILVFLKIKIKVEAKNSKTRTLPILSKE
jgi:hypothetical protein